jgi:hypothetical protein
MIGFLGQLGIRFTLLLSLQEIVAIASPVANDLAQQVVITTLPKVPGESPAYYCSDPSDDIFRIDRLDFIPTNPRV